MQSNEIITDFFSKLARYKTQVNALRWTFIAWDFSCTQCEVSTVQNSRQNNKNCLINDPFIWMPEIILKQVLNQGVKMKPSMSVCIN